MARRFWHEWFKEILLALALALVIRAGIAEASVIPTPSMVPTVLPGDRVFSEKLIFRVTGLQRGDIVILTPPFPSAEDLIKRVIGLPGDTVSVHDGKVWVNDAPLSEPYINEAPRYVYGPVKVPAEKLLVLGDNRNISYDSHAWGLLDLSAVHGHALVRYWPLSRIGVLH